MINGMLPMALGFGEGGEQNAPLGRAVIGGLSMATLATLFFVPVVYSARRRKQPQASAEEEVALAEPDVVYRRPLNCARRSSAYVFDCHTTPIFAS